MYLFFSYSLSGFVNRVSISCSAHLVPASRSTSFSSLLRIMISLSRISLACYSIFAALCRAICQFLRPIRFSLLIPAAAKYANVTFTPVPQDLLSTRASHYLPSHYLSHEEISNSQEMDCSREKGPDSKIRIGLCDSATRSQSCLAEPIGLAMSG